MGEAVLVAIISGCISLVGTILTIIATSKKQAETFAVKQAVIEERIQTLTESVDKHNAFGTRIPVLEEKIAVANHRIDDLERRAAQ